MERLARKLIDAWTEASEAADVLKRAEAASKRAEEQLDRARASCVESGLREGLFILRGMHYRLSFDREAKTVHVHRVEPKPLTKQDSDAMSFARGERSGAEVACDAFDASKAEGNR